MTPSDAIAIYGGIVATIVALVQIHQWRKSSEIFSIRIYDEFYEKWNSDIEFSITNLTNKEIEIHYIWFGAGYRPWLAPWKRKYVEAIAAREVTDVGVGNQFYLVKIGPGQLVSAYVLGKDVRQMSESFSLKSGFSNRPCFWVEHSLSKKPVWISIDA